jgi:hypothetical protein
MKVRPGRVTAHSLTPCAFYKDLFRPGTTGAESVLRRPPGRRGEDFWWSREIRRAAFEMVRARAATNSAIALRRALSAGEMESRKLSEKAQAMST